MAKAADPKNETPTEEARLYQFDRNVPAAPETPEFFAGQTIRITPSEKAKRFPNGGLAEITDKQIKNGETIVKGKK